ncbi:VIT1/CCC1 transporter family protein [Patescibacteria group bacterium]
MKKTNITNSLREIVFGFEDGIVSTLGVITGIAGGTQDRFTVILAGLVVVSVESLSMAAGTYLSNKTEEQLFAKRSKKSLHAKLHLKAIDGAGKDALLMGISYVVGGVIPVIPYFFIPLSQGLVYSVAGSMVGLAVIGFWRAKITETSIFKGMFEMILVSSIAALVGFSIGKLASNIFPQLKGVV